MNQPHFSVLGAETPRLPSCPGVYRFLDAERRVLYVGKSVDIRARVRSHLNEAKHSNRQHRMWMATATVDCRPTAGEAGALLLENAAIKREMPLFNRRQRSVRRLWSLVLRRGKNGYDQPDIHSFAPEHPELMEAFGSFRSRHHARESLRQIARRHNLCAGILGLERTRGACFQRQIGACLGACVGRETPAEHNRRLRAALLRHRLIAWPVPGPVLLQETAEKPVAGQPAREWHLLHNWAYLGTFPTSAAAADARHTGPLMFDLDTYRILRSVLQTSGATLHCAQSGTPVRWPTDA